MKKIILLTSLLFFFLLATSADFTSVSNGDWNQGATWGNAGNNVSGSGYPGSSDNATIDGHEVTLTSNESVTNLTFNAGTSKLTMSGGNLISGGNITVNSLSIATIEIGATRRLFFLGGVKTITLNSDLNITGNTGEIDLVFDLTLTGSGKLNVWGIIQISSSTGNTFTTNDALVLKATSSTEFGRFSFTNYETHPLDPSARTVNSNYNIVGKVTMEKVPVTTNQPDNEGWRQWSFPLSGGSADITGLDIQGNGHSPSAAINTYNWNAEVNPTLGVGNANMTSPLSNNKVKRNTATGWAKGWQPSDESNMYRKGFTIFSTNNINTNNAFGYKIEPKITITGNVLLDNVRGGYDANGFADAASAFIPATQDTGTPQSPLLGPTSTVDVGWVQLYNPWPTIIDAYGVISPTGTGGGFGASGDFVTNYPAIHVWDANNQQYLGFSQNAVAFNVVYNTLSPINTATSDFSIYPFQGYWVKNASGLVTSPSIDFGLKYTRGSITGSAYLKTSTIDDIIPIAVYDVDSTYDMWAVQYQAGQSKNFDLQGDLYKLYSSSNVPTLHSKEGEDRAQLASRPPVASDTIQLYFYSYKNNKPVHFHFDDTYASNFDVVLHDKKTNTYHNMSQNPNYTFTHNTNDSDTRFELIVSNGSIGIDEKVLTSNPVSLFMSGDELVIKSEHFTGPTNIEAYDMAGRLLFDRNIDLVAGAELRFAAPLAKNQINVIKVTANGQQYTQKLFR